MTSAQCLSGWKSLLSFFCFRLTLEKDRKEYFMPKTKFETLVFTFITAWVMVYFMTLYNIVLASGEFTNWTFWYALKGMWIEFVVIFLCALFISSPLAKIFAFRIVKPTDRPIAIIFAIQTFTVIFQVALASILGTYKAAGFNVIFIPNYLSCYCHNFIMAFPLQLIIAGPFARFLFRLIFRREEKKEVKEKA